MLGMQFKGKDGVWVVRALVRIYQISVTIKKNC